jgi:hypothetical protein
MEKVEIEQSKDVELPPEEMNFDIAQYKKQLFGMFNGEATAVTIDIDKSLVDAVFDLFGEQTKMVTSGENTVRFTVNVQVSDLFFGWCSSFRDNLKLLAPEETVDDYRYYLNELSEKYTDIEIENAYEKGIFVMDYLKGLGVDMTAVLDAICDQNLEQSYQLIKYNPNITKQAFLTIMGISEV